MWQAGAKFRLQNVTNARWVLSSRGLLFPSFAIMTGRRGEGVGGGTVIKTLSPLHCTAFMRLCFFVCFFFCPNCSEIHPDRTHTASNNSRKGSLNKKKQQQQKKIFQHNTTRHCLCDLSEKWDERPLNQNHQWHGMKREKGQPTRGAGFNECLHSLYLWGRLSHTHPQHRSVACDRHHLFSFPGSSPLRPYYSVIYGMF